MHLVRVTPLPSDRPVSAAHRDAVQHVRGVILTCPHCGGEILHRIQHRSGSPDEITTRDSVRTDGRCRSCGRSPSQSLAPTWCLVPDDEIPRELWSELDVIDPAEVPPGPTLLAGAGMRGILLVGAAGAASFIVLAVVLTLLRAC
jgi:hypothetical protein